MSEVNEAAVDTVLEKMKPIMLYLTGDEVAECCAALIAVAAFRKNKSDGRAEAAELCSSLSGLASSIGMDFRKVIK